MMLSDWLSEQRKETINREWKYLNPLQRNIIFLRFALGIFPRIILRAWNRRLLERRAMYAYSYPAHWV